MNIVEIKEILKNLSILQKEKVETFSAYETASKKLDEFEHTHKEELHKHRIEIYNNEKKMKIEKNKLNNDVNEKIFDYIEIGMWVSVKTNSGKIWQKVVEKNVSKWDSKYNTIRCSRPRKSYIPINALRREDKSIAYTLSLFGPEHVDRSDNYVINSIVDVLVPINDGFYESKSFRKDIVHASE